MHASSTHEPITQFKRGVDLLERLEPAVLPVTQLHFILQTDVFALLYLLTFFFAVLLRSLEVRVSDCGNPKVWLEGKVGRGTAALEEIERRGTFLLQRIHDHSPDDL